MTSPAVASAARIVLCEDDESFIDAVASALAGTSDLVLDGVARSLAERLRLLDGPPAQVLLVDLGLPDGSGIALIRQARRCWPDCLVMVCTMFGDEAHVVRSLEAGATGCLLKDHPQRLQWQCRDWEPGFGHVHRPQRHDRGHSPASHGWARRAR